MSAPKVSVLMPIYNTDINVLKQAIESILSQTFSEFEYLIVNDSPDNTKLDKTVRSYQDERIIYLKNDKNLGLEDSTNKLIDISKGEYIAIFDHDDISLPYRLEKEVAYLDAHPQVGVCSAQFRVFGEENWISNNPCENEEIKMSLEEISCVSHSAAMFRKSVLTNNDIKYEKEYFPAASYRIITQLALISDVHNLSEVLLEYRMGADNTSILFKEERQISRSKISSDYIEKRKTNKLKDIFKFDYVERIGELNTRDERRYYKARKGKEHFFVKSGAYSYGEEYKFLKDVYSRDKKHFLRPVDFYDGDVNYLVIQWSNESVNLSEYLAKKKVSIKQKETFVQDLYEIWSILNDLRIVHRDIIPRNFMVESGHLLLVDFYWAVKIDQYKEYGYIKEDIRALSLLGEDFAAGIYKWDDSYSFVKVIEYISDKDVINNTCKEKITNTIGDRVITPDPLVFHKAITKQVEQNDELQRQYSDLQQQNNDLQKQNDELQRQYSDLQQQNNDLQKQNTTIRDSLSWRLTKPLRLSKRFLRKIYHSVKR